MPIKVENTSDDNSTLLKIIDRFDYSVHKEFREAYKNTSPNTKFVIDMSQASYMDSSALGMLLLLREHAGDDTAKISIIGCNPEIKRILEISNFHHQFKVS